MKTISSNSCYVCGHGPSSYSARGLNFHTIPKPSSKLEIRDKWLEFLHLPPTSVWPKELWRNITLCSLHFEESNYSPRRQEQICTRLLAGSVPSKNRPSSAGVLGEIFSQLPESTCLDPPPSADAENNHTLKSYDDCQNQEQLPNQFMLNDERKKLCRLCGLKGSLLIPLFTVLSGSSSLIPLLSKIEMYLPFKVKEEDPLPYHICLQCCDILNQWHDFYVNSVAADTALWKIFGGKTKIYPEDIDCTNPSFADDQQNAASITVDGESQIQKDPSLTLIQHEIKENKDVQQNTPTANIRIEDEAEIHQKPVLPCTPHEIKEKEDVCMKHGESNSVEDRSFMVEFDKNFKTFRDISYKWRICQQHFEDECFVQEGLETSDGSVKVNRSRLKLIPGSIPTKLLALKKSRKEKPRERIPLYTYNGLVSALRKPSNSSDPSEKNSAAIDHNYIATMVPTEPQIAETKHLCKDNEKDLHVKQHTLDNLRRKLCRLCGQKGSELMPIFESASDPSKDVSISSKIDSYLPIKLNLDDSLPFGVCSNCLSVLNIWHDFYMTCVAADAVLWKTFGKESPDTSVHDLCTSEVQQNAGNVEEIPANAFTDETVTHAPTEESLLKSLCKEEEKGEDIFTHCGESNQTLQNKNKSFEDRCDKTCTYLHVLYKCHFCSDLFKTSADYKNHISKCCQLSTICELCGHKGVCRNDLKRHKFSSHKVVPAKYSRDKCERCFKSANQLYLNRENNNETNHSGKYYCELCGSMFRQDDCHINKTKHENINSESVFRNEGFHQEITSEGSENGVGYACPVCQEKFNDMLSLAVHVT